MFEVLVVDDCQGVRETYDSALRHAGYSVLLADSGAGAIATLASVKPDAILLDLNLGDMTGYDVLRWMRNRGFCVPTAVMTAFRFKFDPDEAIALGAMAYSDQPLSIDDVLTLVESPSAPPSALDDMRRLHAWALDARPGALECLDTVFLKVLPPRLQRAFPRAPWDFVVDAATDASLEYGTNPARFDSTGSSSVVGFVYLIARRNLMDRLRSESKRKDREARWAKQQPSVVFPELGTERSHLDVWAGIVAVTKNSPERRAVELWLDGASHDAIAEALGFGLSGPVDRRKEAKRFKDRLLKRLSRYFGVMPVNGRIR